MTRLNSVVLLLLTAAPLILAQSIVKRQTQQSAQPSARPGVILVFDHVDTPIRVPLGFATDDESAPLAALSNPRSYIQSATNQATIMALSAWRALLLPGVEHTPEFRLFFGTHGANAANTVATLRAIYSRVWELAHPSNLREVHFDLRDTAPNNNGAGHTFADTNGNQITIFRNTWRDFRPHQLNTPVFVVETNDILESIDGMQSYATTILHELFHLIGDDDQRPNGPGPFPMLTTVTNPPETSEFSGVIDMAVHDPDHAIYNPDTLSDYALAVHSGVMAGTFVDPNTYAPIVQIAQAPDIFDQLTNLTRNTYGVYQDDVGVESARPWMEFKKTGKAPSSWDWILKSSSGL